MILAMQPPSPTNAQYEGAHALTYTGRTGELFSLYFSNLLLSIISLGIYRFWGKARVRRYLWAHILFQGEPFCYTGTGKELFKGFLKILFFLAIPAGLIWQAVTMLTAAALEGMVLLVIVAALSPFVAFQVRRFRLSRSDWRCIKFAQTGEAKRYALKALAGWFLSFCTLFFYVPYNAMRLFDYQINRIQFGTLGFTYNAKKHDLAGGYLPLWIAAFVLIILFFIGLGACSVTVYYVLKQSHEKFMTAIRHKNIVGLLLAPFLLLLLALPAIALARLKYRLLIYRHVVACTSLGPMRATFTATFWQFIRLKFFNFLIIVASFGLLIPVAMHRRMKFMCRHLRFQGLPDFGTVTQIASLDRSGEGWTQWFDVDALDF
jgi:uncharacterized membrane protein YjgN (DUF898 family)